MRRSRRTAGLAVVLAAAVIGTGGCGRAISGTAVAPPGQAGLAAKANTTCGEFVEMTDAERRDVIEAIGDSGDKPFAKSPELWVIVAAGLCKFREPDSLVKDILSGGMR